MLTGTEIRLEYHRGNIVIQPWDTNRVNPNSYNLRLGSTLYYYPPNVQLDLKNPVTPIGPIEIPAEGIVLLPGNGYLGQTLEFTETRNLIPVLDGRSSIGRLFMVIHHTAGFGDINFRGHWTLEIAVMFPTRVYVGAEICQIRYHRPDGATSMLYAGKYQGATSPMPSLIHEEFEENKT